MCDEFFVTDVSLLNSLGNYGHAMSSHALNWNFQTRKKMCLIQKAFTLYGILLVALYSKFESSSCVLPIRLKMKGE